MSIVWAHFGFSVEDIEQKEVECKYCRKKVSVSSGNTTNLLNNLQHNHATQYEEYIAQKKRETNRRPTTSASTKQLSLSQAFTNATQYAKDSKRWKEISDAITYYIVKDMAPITTVAHKGFKHLLKTLDRTYTVIAKIFFANYKLLNMYQTCREKVVAEIKSVKHFTATSDLWSSRTILKPHTVLY